MTAVMFNILTTGADQWYPKEGKAEQHQDDNADPGAVTAVMVDSSRCVDTQYKQDQRKYQRDFVEFTNTISPYLVLPLCLQY